MDISITTKQEEFINSTSAEIPEKDRAFEVLFGGAAGGGKSYGQLIDALLYALKYSKSKQIIFRSTFPDLEKSLIRTSLELFPREIANYNSSKHTWTFQNGSIIDFGYIQYQSDVYQYQSAEYDVIRFDELTHFTEYMYTYMISRCRGANPYPKAIKSSTNPGGVGHVWVKERFIDIGDPNVVHKVENDNGTTSNRIFIPSLVTDNKFMLKYDPEYINRLDNLPEKDRKALKFGDWDIYDGMYFSEFDKRIHVIDPFEIPSEWDKYVALDYGLDMFAVVFAAIDEKGNGYIYKEIHQSDLIVSDAARLLKEAMVKENIRYIFAPPDLWNRNRDTGKSAFEIFRDNGIFLTKAGNSRVNGWYSVKEWLKLHDFKNEQTGQVYKDSDLHIFSNCRNLIRCLPQLQHDDARPNDVAKEPHEITHITDALRYFCVMRISPTEKMLPQKKLFFNWSDEEPTGTDWGEEIVVV